MADSSKRPSPKASDDHEDDFGGNALTELMTGAFAATSMVAMSVDPDEDIPALPEWEPPTTKPPSVELLNEAGTPIAIDSGDDFLAVPDPDDEVDVEVEVEDDAPALSGSLLATSIDPYEEPSTEPIDRTLDVEARAQQQLSVNPSVPARAPFAALHNDTVPQPAAAARAAAQDAEAVAAALEAAPLELEPEPALETEDEPAATMSAEPGVVVRAQRAPATDFTGSYETVAAHIRSPSPKPSKSPWPRILGVAGALGVVALIGWAWASTSSAPASNGQPQVAPASAAALKDAPAAQPAPTAPVEPKKDDAAPPAADEAASKAYAAAKLEYDKTETQSALIVMVESACQLEDGPTARIAFRKLVGGKLRSRALLACRELGVDVTALGEGFTASELADQAQIALDAGKASEALDLARSSNRSERNDRAIRLIVMSSCKLKKRKGAKKMLRHVAEKKRPPVVEFCVEAGVRL